eukprot:TRINITY_DN784_c0_g1_i4.p2 TRINITY_DN784_c0_g1~~TRINITY_DN784_c0_g1_i4.p2  ORF type:complete len:104 (-),score=31.37 TRINITY_DN784_c0_g1_i4:411-722(-)
MVKVMQSEAEFNTLVGSDSLTVVDFYADWCGPCMAIKDEFAGLADKYPSANFAKVDVDSLSSLASKFGVQGIPCFMFFKNGEKVDEVVGANINSVKAKIELLK